MTKKDSAERRAHIIAWVLISIVLLYAASMLFFAFMQYRHFLYDALDLGIYTQVMFRFLSGDWFAYTFNPYSYLADHREWILILFIPFFALIPHPMTLVALQIVALCASAYPAFYITQHIYGKDRRAQLLSVVCVCALLIHPSIQAILLYEFHALSFVVPIALMMWLAILRGKFVHLWLWSLLALSVREDVGAMVLGTAVLLWIQHHHRRARVHATLLAGLALLYSVLAVLLGGVWFPGGSEKFFVFYPQLGTSFGQVIHTVLTHPLQAFAPLWQYDHVWIVVLLCSSVGFLCLLAPRYLLPAVLPLVLLLLIPKEMLPSVLRTHYSAPIVPWVMIAAWYGLAHIRSWHRKRLALVVLTASGVVVLIHALLLSSAMYTLALIGDVDQTSYANVQKNLAHIDATDAIVVSHTFASHLSLRTEIYPLLHIFRGKEHYSDTPYILSEGVDWVVLNPRDMIEMTMNFATEDTASGWQRLASIIDVNNLILRVYTPDIWMWGPREDLREGGEELLEQKRIQASVAVESSHSSATIEVMQDIHTQSVTWSGVTIERCVKEPPDADVIFLQCRVSRSASAYIEHDVHVLIEWLAAPESHGVSSVLAQQWFPLINNQAIAVRDWTPQEQIVRIPMKSIDAASVQLNLVSVAQQSKKIFLSRQSMNISDLPHATLDITSIYMSGVFEK